MIKVYANIKINRHHQEVFDYISNFENNPKWQGGMVDARFTSAGPLQKGSTYDQTAKFLGKEVITSFLVTEFHESKKIKIESQSSTFPITVTRSVTPVENGTSVSAEVVGAPGKYYKIINPLLKWMVHRSVNADYKRLKKILE